MDQPYSFREMTIRLSRSRIGTQGRWGHVDAEVTHFSSAVDAKKKELTDRLEKENKGKAYDVLKGILKR
jgi:hypothetical protein